jgi:Tfp pilus assembly protein PilO
MEIVGPVIGIGAIIMIGAAGIVMIRRLAPRAAQPQFPTERDQVLEDVQARFGELDQVKQRLSELEERVDFAERLLAKQREAPRLGPSHD